MLGVGLEAVRRIGRQVPTALFGGDVHDAMPVRLLGPDHGLHRELLDLFAGGNVGGGQRRPLAAKFAEQTGRHDQRPAQDNRRAVLNVPHRLEFLLATVESGLEIVERAFRVVEIQPHVFAGLPVFVEFHPAIGPEGDFLGEPIVDGGERLLDMLDAAFGDFLVMLRHERRGGQRDGLQFLVGAYPRSVEQVRSMLGRSARGRAVRGRGAAPSRRMRRIRPDSRG